MAPTKSSRRNPHHENQAALGTLGSVPATAPGRARRDRRGYVPTPETVTQTSPTHRSLPGQWHQRNQVDGTLTTKIRRPLARLALSPQRPQVEPCKTGEATCRPRRPSRRPLRPIDPSVTAPGRGRARPARGSEPNRSPEPT